MVSTAIRTKKEHSQALSQEGCDECQEATCGDRDKWPEFIANYIRQSQSFSNFTQSADIAIFTQRAYIVTVEERIHGYG
jgi:hypothetical protein